MSGLRILNFSLFKMLWLLRCAVVVVVEVVVVARRTDCTATDFVYFLSFTMNVLDAVRPGSCACVNSICVAACFERESETSLRRRAN